MAAKKKTKAKAASRRMASPRSAKKRAVTRSAPKRTPRRRVERRKPDHPESLRLRSAAPSFTVDDLRSSLAFYEGVLGFFVKERWEHEGVLRGVELAAGNVSLYLGQDDWLKGRGRAKGVGFRVYCTTSQDLDALVARIKARGGVLTEELQSRPWGGRDFAVQDPDGFKITISSE
jgi:uncharacterized glyoxalase superfamily protein PhnB